MPLDPQAQELLDRLQTAALGLLPISEVPLVEARARVAKALTYPAGTEPIAHVVDFSIPGPGGRIPIRHYKPSAEKLLPAVVFFHGGGWVLNNLTTHDHVCRALANQSGCAVIAPDYRLAPEHPFPAGIEDAWAVTRWVFDNAARLGVDTNRIGVVGDSSGGAQAAVVSQLASDNGGPSLACQALIYPVVDHYSVNTGSYREMGTGYSLTEALMIWFWNQYLSKGGDLNDPRVCPLRAKNLAGLPPTLVLTAEFDPLRDEAEDYVRRLQAAGVRAKASRYTGMMHGFVSHFPVLDKGRLGLAETAAFLRQNLERRA